MNMMDTTIDLTQKTGLLQIQLPTVNIQVVIQANNHQLLISPRIENLAVNVLAMGEMRATCIMGEGNFVHESFRYIASESSGTIVKVADAQVADASELVLESITGEIPREVSTDLPATVDDLIIASDVPAIASESIPTLLPVTSAAESPSEVSTKRPACSYSDDNNSTAKKQTTERNSRMIEEEKVTKQEEITPRALLAELKTVIRQRREVDPFDPVSFFLFYNFDLHCFDTAVQDFIAYKRVMRKERLFEMTFI